MCNFCFSRRGFLTKLAAVSVAAVAPGSLLAQAKPHRIDVHYHPIAPEWLADEVVKKRMAPEVFGKANEWTPNRAIEEMDRNKIATVICSVSNPGVWFGDQERGRRLARACNEYTARLMGDYPGRFGLFASLPLPDTEGSLAEISHAFDVLGANGIGLFTSYGDKWLADPSFSPVFKELNRRKAVVYVHPAPPSCCVGLFPNIPSALLEYPIDTARTMLQWIMTKSALLYPDIRLIFSHAGGLMMAGVGRLQILAETQTSIGLPDNFPAEIAKFYYEISSSADAVTMSTLLSYAPVSHVLLGTDSPFIGPMAPNLAQLEKLGLSKVDLDAIERSNAKALMPALQ